MFIFRGYDKENGLNIRLENRDAHVAWLKQLGDVLKLAGPTLDDEGQMNGSVLLLDCATRAEAEALLAADPYAKAGLFAQTNLSPYKVVICQL